MTTNCGAVTFSPVTRGAQNQDPFGNLRTELLQMILLYLPSKQVLNLKLSSYSFAQTPLFDQFWASQFWPGREYEYVIHGKETIGRFPNWKAIYLEVKSLKGCSGLINRHRIWRLGAQLRNLIIRVAGIDCQGIAIQSYFEQKEEPDSSTWITVSRALRSHNGFSQRVVGP
jgi:hypothetical protein